MVFTTTTATTTMFLTILLSSLITFTPGWMVVDAQIITYRVTLNPLFPNSAHPAFGFATIFADTSKSMVGYAGIASNLESDITPSKCTATNACGVHIHSGRSCASAMTQGSNYYNNTTVSTDPWKKEEYTTDKNGKANFQSIVNIGTVDIEGRVLIGAYNECLSFPFTLSLSCTISPVSPSPSHYPTVYFLPLNYSSFKGWYPCSMWCGGKSAGFGTNTYHEHKKFDQCKCHWYGITICGPTRYGMLLWYRKKFRTQLSFVHE